MKQNIKYAPLSKFIDLNPENISKNYPYNEIEYIDISSVASGYLNEKPIILNLANAPSRAKRIVRENDSILATVRPNLRAFLYITNPKLNTIVSTGFAVLRAKDKVTPRFIYYAITNPVFTGYLTNNAKGTSYPAVDTNIILRGEIPDFPYITQQKIADILSNYDELIENNRRRIELLEESARSLYREWFVYLRFPGHEHIPIIDGVPEGWEKKKIGDVVSLLKRGITPNYDDHAQSIVINQKCIRNHLINLQLARHQSKSVPQEKLLLFGDILINSTGAGTLGRVAQFFQDIGNCTVDSHVTIARPKRHIPKFYLGIFLGEMESYLSSMGRGATNQTELSCSTISEISVLIPSQIISQEFEDFVNDVFSQIDNLIKQNQKLAEARDLLLPRLMNGEIAV